jgi:hypothetical protein
MFLISTIQIAKSKEKEQTDKITDLKRWSKGKNYFWLFDISEFNGRVGAKAVKA